MSARCKRLLRHTKGARQAWPACAQESLGGNAKTSLVIAVANAAQHSEETLQSLQFGSRAMRVRTQAVVNECLDFKARPALQALLCLHLASSRGFIFI